MASGRQEDGAGLVDDDAELPAPVVATVRRLVDEGIGTVLGFGPDRRRRSAVTRVARLGPEELPRRLDELYSSHQGALVGYATRLIGNPHDAEDVVNESFMRVLRSDPDLRAPAALAGYVRTVVRNEAYDRGRQLTRDRQSHERSDLDELGDRLAATDQPVEDRVCDQLSLAVAVGLLSHRQRQCFGLRYLDGLSVHDTAARMAISEGNVKRLCHEIRSRLASVLAVG